MTSQNPCFVRRGTLLQKLIFLFRVMYIFFWTRFYNKILFSAQMSCRLFWRPFWLLCLSNIVCGRALSGVDCPFYTEFNTFDNISEHVQWFNLYYINALDSIIRALSAGSSAHPARVLTLLRLRIDPSRRLSALWESFAAHSLLFSPSAGIWASDSLVANCSVPMKKRPIKT